MIVTKKISSGLFFTVLFFPLIAYAQATAPGPASGNAKPAQHKKKPVFTLRTIGVAPLYVFEINDNAKINATHQFSGARMLPKAFHFSGERHLRNIRQLTFEGVNTRPTISPDDRYLAFQAHGVKPNSCDQIYRMPLSGIPAGRISSGKGRATGAAFLRSDEIVYSSTQAVDNGACPAPPSVKDVWRLDKGAELYISDTNGKAVRQLKGNPAHYNGEAAVSPNGGRIIFTSTRTGDPELFSMNPDGSALKQLTHHVGFDGDASYSPMGNEIVFSGSRPKRPALAEYKKSLAKGYADRWPSEIYVMNIDGSGERELTHLAGANYAPCWMPDGTHILFTSNHLDPTGKAFDLFMIKSDGTGLERITHGGGFNGFPVFTRDGKHLVFCSSRNATHPNDVNIFLADWVQ